MKLDDGEAEGCLACIIGLFLTPFIVVWQGWVACCLWAWFAVPVFSAPPISVPASIGLLALWRFLRARMPKNDDEKVEKVIAMAMGYGAFYPATALLTGFIAKQFM